MTSYFKPNKRGAQEIFNVSDYNYQDKNILYNGLQTVVNDSNTIDTAQDELITQIVSSANALTESVNTNTTYQTKTNALEAKTLI